MPQNVAIVTILHSGLLFIFNKMSLCAVWPSIFLDKERCHIDHVMLVPRVGIRFCAKLLIKRGY